MKNLMKIVPIIALMSIYSCEKNQKADQLVVEDQVVATTDVPAPTENQAPLQTQDEMLKQAQANPSTTIALSESAFSFGKLKKGDHVEHVYEVTNTGKNPLIISQVKPGCGCTVPDYTQEPILPGKKGKITLKFDSSNFDGTVQKQAEVYANVEKAPIVLSFTADIQP